MHSIVDWRLWVGFFIFILAMIAIDMILLGGKKLHRSSTRETLGWVMVWVSLALMFNFLLWLYLSHRINPTVANQKALEFFTGYLIELSLSVDNMFVFILIFRYFSVKIEYQRRVLLYGVLGAIIMRLIIITLGVILVAKFHWVLYLFGLLLLLTGTKMLFMSEEVPHFENNPLLRLMRRCLRVTDTINDEQFFVRKNKLLYATPLFLVLILIEMSDLIFALDSIPAIFAITNDAFIIFSSNIFAILGLRALYFLLAHMANRFHYLKYGIALILLFIGTKMLMAYWMQIPVYVALGVIAIILLISILVSIIKPVKHKMPAKIE